jgi:predicted Rossmann fold nucleotide-binding protein DprA/Smf involved in DNA uptake
VTSSDDVARRLGLPTIAETSPKSPLETALRAGPQTLDELVASTGCRPAELRAKLGELELEGRVRRRAGRYEA